MKMKKPPCNKPASLKVSRGSATSVGPLRNRGFGSTKSQATARTAITLGPVKTPGKETTNKLFKPQASKIPKLVQTAGNKTKEPVPADSAPKSPVQTTWNNAKPDLQRLNMFVLCMQQDQGKTKEPVTADSAPKSHRPAQTTWNKSKPVPAYQAPKSVRFPPTPGNKTSAPASSAEVSTNHRPDFKIPFYTGGIYRGSAYRNAAPTQTTGAKTNKQIATVRGPKATEPWGRNLSASRNPGRVQTKEPVYSNRASKSLGPVQTGRPRNDSVYSHQASTSLGPVKKTELKDRDIKSSKTRFYFTTDGAPDSIRVSTSPGTVQTHQASTSLGPVKNGAPDSVPERKASEAESSDHLVQTSGPLSEPDEPAVSDQASKCPESVESPRCKTRPVSADRAGFKSKIPEYSESRIRGGSCTSAAPRLKANQPVVTSCAFGRSFQTQGHKASEPLSSTSKNRGISRYPSVVQPQKPVPSTRTPTRPAISKNQRPLSRASEPVYSAVRNRGNASTSPSYTRRPSVPKDRAFASPSRIQTQGPKTIKPVPSGVGRSSSKSLGPLLTRVSFSISRETVSSVNRYPRSASTSPGPRSSELVSSKESVTPVNENLAIASKRRGILRTTRSCIPNLKEIHSAQTSGISKADDFMQNPNTDSNLKLTPRRSLALETQLAEELDKRIRCISELEKDLTQNQYIINAQDLCLAEREEVQKAKDAAMEQLKSELLTAKKENDHMHLRLKEAILGLEKATCRVNKFLEHTTTFEVGLKEARDKIVHLERQLKEAKTIQEHTTTFVVELKEARDMIVHLQEQLKEAEARAGIQVQMRQNMEKMEQQLSEDSKLIRSLQLNEEDMRENLEKRDKLIHEITLELAARDEEFRNLFKTLKDKHTRLRSLEDTVKQLEERYERTTIKRSKLKEKNAALLVTVERLKHNLRYYSRILIASDGQPFFEEVTTGTVPEEESQRKEKPKRRVN